MISILESPFEGEESGRLEIVVKQGDQESVVYSEENMTQQAFPLNLDYISDSEEEAIATVYINGEEYSSFPIELSAVAD